ncbi:MAG TPA: glycosyltransferase [Planctomycetaceae bacterium]|nr:glycosyltransferase [Planctomycetaceae bacterium]
MKDTNRLVSVILPLDDHRDQYAKSIQSFLNQTLAPAAVEVLVPCSEANPEIQQEIAQNFPDARLIQAAGLNLHELYNLAAAQASGTYLYLSEMHCVANPDCLAEAIACAEREECDCVCSNSSGINQNAVAAGEQRIFESDLENWKKNVRAKVVIRGFLIARAVWEKFGGLQSAYGHFSEVMLGRNLQEAGKRFGYADRSVIAHCNQSNLKELTASLIQYGYDECHSNHFAPPIAPELLCEEWTKYRDRKEKTATRMRKLKRRLFYLIAFVRFCPPNHACHFRAVERIWDASIRIGRLRYLRELQQAAEQASVLPASV